jgi:hypothetical protein
VGRTAHAARHPDRKWSLVLTLASFFEQVMIYTGGKTLGKQTVEVATKLALSGLLCDKAMKAGSKAVENYNCFDKDRPEASPNVAVEEGQQ